MAKKKSAHELSYLLCSECKERNYHIFRKRGAEKLEIRKFCPRCRAHRVHTEKKK
ncbi:MAG: 50S ribosomal protein L33 [Planctomycetes bacterium]|nr:50S ribosomal protein L33 [Planctomycetota bacterium]